MAAPARPQAARARSRTGCRRRALKLPALRLLELALREDLDDLILAVDPDQPQALFAKFRAGAAQGKDFTLLRQVIAAAPCWARPYGELRADDDADDREHHAWRRPSSRPSPAPGIAALCRPGAPRRDRDASPICSTTPGSSTRACGCSSARVVAAPRRVARAPRAARAASSRPIARARGSRRRIAVGARPRLPDGSVPARGTRIRSRSICCVADALMRRRPARRGDRAARATGSRAARRRGRATRGSSATWRKDPRFVAWCYAREGCFRGDRGARRRGLRPDRARRRRRSRDVPRRARRARPRGRGRARVGAVRARRGAHRCRSRGSRRRAR